MMYYLSTIRKPFICLVILTVIGLSIASINLTQPVFASGTISGTVFRDFNANGIFDINEVGQVGVAVTVYDPDNTVQGTATSDANGSFSIAATGVGPYRVEFSGWPSYLQPGAVGGSNASSVQFVNDGNSTVSFALNDPYEFCQNNPDLCSNTYINGLANTDSPVTTISKVPYNSTGIATQTSLATKSQVGSTWGLTYRRSNGTLYAAAFLKRHVALGPSGLGAIYQIPNANTAIPGTPTLLVDLTAQGIDVGTAPTGRDMTTSGVPSYDANAYPLIGKVGLGGLTISDDESTLWVVNLNDKTLLRIPIATPTALNIASYPIADPSCTGGTYRPFAAKYYHGNVYVGVVCDAQISGVQANLQAYVYRFDPNTTMFTQVLTFPLNYPRGAISADCPGSGWQPWSDAFPAYCDSHNYGLILPQPILSDIVFDVDGSMVIGFIDRLAHQGGFENYSTDIASTLKYTVFSGGDILRAYNNSGTFELESNATSGPNTGGAGNGEGPNNGEFYQGDAFIDSAQFTEHHETVLGGLAIKSGSGEVATTSYDPISPAAGGQPDTGGVTFLSNSNGVRARGYQLYDGSPDFFDKSGGLGDLELLCDAAPIEIGNRIWLDSNGNGRQDADELGIDGVTVQLWADTNNDSVVDTQVGSTITAGNGQYIFGGLANIGMNAGQSVLPNTTYEIRISTAQAALAGEILTMANSAASGGLTTNDPASDVRDSDATLNGTTVVISYTTSFAGFNNHSLDAGFLAPTISIGNQVWYDTNNDGVINTGEVGIDGVRVELFLDTNNNNVLDPAEQTPIAVQTTSNDGYYLFTQTTDATGVGLGVGLSVGQYFIGIAPSNFAPAGVLANSRSSGISISNAGVLSESAFGTTNNDIDNNDDGIVPTSGFYTNGVLSSVLQVTVGGEPTNEPTFGQTAGSTPGHLNTIDGTASGTPIADADSNLSVDFGFYRQSLGNLIFHDLNNNAIFDAGETPLADATVKLFAQDGTTEILVGPDGILGTVDDAIGGVITGATGTYAFQNLPQGNYRVEVTPPTGFTSSTDITSSIAPNNNIDSDDNGVGAGSGTVMSIAVALTPGSVGATNANIIVPTTGTTTDPTLDFGFVSLSIGNLVWNDVNNNGQKDASETGLDGATVNLYQDTNASSTLDAGDILISSQITSNDGHYLFTGVPVGTYFVQLDGSNFAIGDPLAGYTSSTGTNGSTIGPYEPVAALGTIDNDDNGSIATGGITTTGVTGGIISAPILLTAGTQPINETDLGIPIGVTDPAANNNSNLTIDFGLFQPASLGDFVWYDVDKNGLQDAVELGINGIQVSLYDSTGTVLIATTTTATNGAIQGYYHFDNLVPNTSYLIVLDRASDFVTGGPLAGYTLTAADTGANDTLDSDATIVAGMPTISAITRAPGSDTPTYDFGFNTSAALGDYIWLDANNDGIQDASEAGINGITVNLYDSTGTNLLATTTTATNGSMQGYYHFANLDPNTTYQIRLDNSADYATGGPLVNAQLSPANSTTDTADSDGILVAGFPTILVASTAGPGSDTPTYDIGFYRPQAALGDYIWSDLNQNGIQDAGETGINGVTVNLYDSTGTTLIASTTTITHGSVQGYYHFANLIPNTTYQVKLDNLADYAAGGPLSNFLLTPAHQGGNDAVDSDATLVATVPTIISAVTGADGSDILTYDIGFYMPLSIGNLVWNDVNNNGLRDVSETGIDGVIINLYLDTNANAMLDAGDTLITSQITSNGGHYLFTGLGQGTYFVQVDGSNFATGGVLTSYTSSTGTNGVSSGPYEPVAMLGTADNDDNGTIAVGGLTATGIAGGVVSSPISLTLGTQPTNEPDKGLPTSIADPALDDNSNLTVDFGVVMLSALGDTVWYDNNQDGLYQTNEPGVPNILVTLYDSTGAIVTAMTTDPNGHYLFTHLVPATYTVKFSNIPANYIFTAKNQGIDVSLDSNAHPETGMTDSVTLQPGETNLTIDAGIIVNATTAITLERFSAIWQVNDIALDWVTSAELHTWGFYIYRSSDRDRAHAERVSSQIMLAQGHGQGGATYHWLDTTAIPGQHYSYWLEEVEMNSNTISYGPITVRTHLSDVPSSIFLPLIGQ